VHDESLLLERTEECDPGALGEIYDVYFDKIYRYIYRYLGETRLAEDACPPRCWAARHGLAELHKREGEAYDASK
jgi:hypothetical protein